MKHPLNITMILIVLFVVTQIVGISLVYQNIKEISVVEGKTTVVHDTTAIGDRPPVEGQTSFWMIIIGVAIGTALLLLIIKLQAFKLWKVWFLAAVWLAMSVALGVLIPQEAALLIAGFFAIWKIFRPNAIVHNITEIFVYSGIAVLIAPLFDLTWVILLLVVISLYDMYAVWMSKHMVTLAKAQTKSNLFAGLYIPQPHTQHLTPPTSPKKSNTKKTGTAILGGGDIAFPLIFSSVVLTWLIEERMFTPEHALWSSLVVTACATIALSLLFAASKKGKFYPAMPPISIGCLIGLGIVLLL